MGGDPKREKQVSRKPLPHPSQAPSPQQQPKCRIFELEETLFLDEETKALGPSELFRSRACQKLFRSGAPGSPDAQAPKAFCRP